MRFKVVNTVEDFTDSANGMEMFDSICMLLITIGEGLKKLDKGCLEKLDILFKNKERWK
jgi:hypothetical protein